MPNLDSFDVAAASAFASAFASAGPAAAAEAVVANQRMMPVEMFLVL